ncbi:hypothetical protein [Ferrimonas lipolytica]|uniref:Uncharacterized protein n=1 Tax=Ferrimonas lipolytica TaxID=2724191 RepID=A0A6H1UHI9_9GAMM|nr:hypothetical protein [Ferrimonas lipolytica]QIZ78070.1 hypothetical protein HER31_14890 [Ferrimonas lipolytica]
MTHRKIDIEPLALDVELLPDPAPSLNVSQLGTTTDLHGDTFVQVYESNGNFIVSVMTYDGSNWSLEQAFSFSGEYGDTGVLANHIRVRGDTIAVSSYDTVNAPDKNAGVVYIYRRVSVGNWVHEQTLQSPIDPSFDYPRYFGSSIAIGQDIIFVGLSDSNNDTGIISYKRSGSIWTRDADLVMTDGTTEIGESMTISPDGALLVASDGTNSDYAAVFEDVAGTWTQTHYIRLVTGAFSISYSTESFAWSPDSKNLVVHDWSYDQLGIHHYDGTSWSKTTTRSYIYDQTNSSYIRMFATNDGLIGIGDRINANPNGGGILRSFKFDADTNYWEFLGDIHHPNSPNNSSGWCGSVHAHQSGLVITATGDDVYGSDDGAAYLIKSNAGSFANLTYKVSDGSYAIPTDIQARQSGSLTSVQRAFTKGSSGTYVQVWERS